MAGSKEANKQWKWPGPVTFNDDDPEKGYSTLFLSIPELIVNTSLFGKATAKNAEVTVNFTSELVSVQVVVKTAGDQEENYEYKKPLPEDIDPNKCSHKVKKAMIVVKLCKKSGESWAQHAKYLIKRD